MGKALCDFGASINLMPLSIVKILSLGKLTPTAMTLEMADRTLAQLVGILEDVLIKVRKFIFPMNVVVIDIEKDNARKAFPCYKSSFDRCEERRACKNRENFKFKIFR